MKKLFFVLCVLAIATTVSNAQSATSKTFSFSKEEVTDIYMPPVLKADIDFQTASGDKILEANERGMISVIVSNEGGKTDFAEVIVEPRRPYKYLSFLTRKASFTLATNENKKIDFPLFIDINAPSDSLELDIKVREKMGYDIDATLIVYTIEYQKAKLTMQGVSILDSGVGLIAKDRNPDGKVQVGETVRAVVPIQNIGYGDAKNVKYSIASADPNILLFTDKGPSTTILGTLETLPVGGTKEISFRFSPNNRYVCNSKYLPIYLTVQEDTGFGNITSQVIPIPLGSSPDALNVVKMDSGSRDKLLALRQARVITADDRVSSNGKIRDLSIAPSGKPLYSNAIAIVIGAEENKYGVAPAPYAARDAKIIANYFEKSMGISNIIVKTNEEVTSTTLSDIFEPTYGDLAKYVEPGKTDVFVFYSGHGIPDKSTGGDQDIFLFPYDARKEMINTRGYSLNKLYADLNSLKAKSVTVFLDACFSGGSRQSLSHASENISNTKGMAIKMDDLRSKPWVSNPNFRVFASSSADQTSLGYDQSQSGLFTYFLATGLQGDADANGDGTIRVDELVKFVTSGVSAEARKIRGADQTPQFYGNSNFIVEIIK